MKMFRSHGQSKIELGEPKRYRMIKRLEPIIELHILMMLLCSDADQGQADTEHQSSDVKQIIWLEGVVNVREHKRQPPVISPSKYRWLPTR